MKVLIIIDEVWKEKNSFLYNQGATLTLMPWFLESISDMKTILQSLIKGRKASNLTRLMIKEAPYILSFPQFSFYSMVAMQIMFHRGILPSSILMLVSFFKIHGAQPKDDLHACFVSILFFFDSVNLVDFCNGKDNCIMWQNLSLAET